jgi:hypothetical protein
LAFFSSRRRRVEVRSARPFGFGRTDHVDLPELAVSCYSGKSQVGVATIRRAELRENETSLTAPNDRAIRRALEEAGVEFIDANGGGPGVRLRENNA